MMLGINFKKRQLFLGVARGTMRTCNQLVLFRGSDVRGDARWFLYDAADSSSCYCVHVG